LKAPNGPARKKIKLNSNGAARLEARLPRTKVQASNSDGATSSAATVTMEEKSDVGNTMKLKMEAYEEHIEVLRNRCLDFLSDFAHLRGWLESQKRFDSEST
jgi:hypothetical protein